jgi:predicted dehydrogenase
VAFIGAGIVAEMHGRAVKGNPDATLIGVCDPEAARARGIVKRFGGKVFREIKDALEDPRVNAVHVLTPPEHHVEVCLASLKAGKHVLVEKPVAWRAADIQKLQSAAGKAGRVCMPAYNYIYNPSLQRAKRLIHEGKLGHISSLWVLYNIYHSEAVAARYGGVLRAVCVHYAYSLLYLLGRPERLMATASRVHYKGLECEDQAMIVCQMPNGAIANLWCSFAAKDLTSDPWTVVYKVLGTEGGLTYSWNEAQFENDRGPGWGMQYYVESFQNEVDHFINCCVHEDQRPLSTLQEAIDALRIIESGRAVIPPPGGDGKHRLQIEGSSLGTRTVELLLDTALWDTGFHSARRFVGPLAPL